MWFTPLLRGFFLLMALGPFPGCLVDRLPLASSVSAKSPATARLPPRYTLRAEHCWQLSLPQGERFDASGLLLRSSGELLTVNDRGATLYEIHFLERTNAADLVPLPGCFTPDQLAPLTAGQLGRLDCEGIAQDDQGRLYLCEESNRWIIRCDPQTGQVERLNIDWSPVARFFDPVDRNASFEGVAVGDGRLYVANERKRARIMAVDLATLKVVDDFVVHAGARIAHDHHYSDLSWYDHALYVLLRESRCVLQVEPVTHRVLAEFSFAEMELDPEAAYRSIYPTGAMEGLAVDGSSFWLVTDNNGTARVRYPQDTRPILFKCRRPDVQ